jgi:hypothetical protein
MRARVEKPNQVVPSALGLARSWAGIAASNVADLIGRNRPSMSALPSGVDQQDYIGGRGRAFSLQARQNTGVVGIHPIDLDTGGLGEILVKRLICLVVTGRIQVQYLLLSCRATREVQQGGSDKAGQNWFFRHEFDVWKLQWNLV